VYRLERSEAKLTVSSLATTDRIILLAGSEGTGIHLPIEGTSVEIPHDPQLESLNVGHAVAIALYARS
jgi:tRNA G18 (ribose-2'-O)-methylase SpoU